MTALVMGILAFVFFSMRFISKIIGFVPYGTDDTLILVAFVRHFYHRSRLELMSNSQLSSRQLWSLLFVRALIIRRHHHADECAVTSKGLGLDTWHVRDENITAHYQVRISGPI
jgi:hypothetical protein